ncbi:hypothetical protein LTR85_002333 [Meristemomyces frigidus]|nr:hypothetical protein LTR85_002333 [Meristemomyces frigidus]
MASQSHDDGTPGWLDFAESSEDPERRQIGNENRVWSPQPHEKASEDLTEAIARYGPPPSRFAYESSDSQQPRTSVQAPGQRALVSHYGSASRESHYTIVPDHSAASYSRDPYYSAPTWPHAPIWRPPAQWGHQRSSAGRMEALTRGFDSMTMTASSTSTRDSAAAGPGGKAGPAESSNTSQLPIQQDAADPVLPHDGLLYKDFKVRDKDAKRFFVLGKVFHALWSEPGDSRTVVTGKAWTQNKFGEWVYSKVRRFVVVRANSFECLAVPITSYGGQGVYKKGVKKADHAIIYTGRHPPAPHPREQPTIAGEAGMQPFPVRVDPDLRDTKLDEMSRIDLSRPHIIQHYQKVKSFGKVNRDSMVHLVTQYHSVSTDESSLSSLRVPLGARASLSSETTAAPMTLAQQAVEALVTECSWTRDKALAAIEGGHEEEAGHSTGSAGVGWLEEAEAQPLSADADAGDQRLDDTNTSVLLSVTHDLSSGDDLQTSQTVFTESNRHRHPHLFDEHEQLWTECLLPHVATTGGMPTGPLSDDRLSERPSPDFDDFSPALGVSHYRRDAAYVTVSPGNNRPSLPVACTPPLPAATNSRPLSPPDESLHIPVDSDHDIRRPSTPPTMAPSLRPQELPPHPFLRQLPRLMRLTDKILLKRTQLGHEDQTLVRRHEFLQESTNDLMAALEDAVPRRRSRSQHRRVKVLHEQCRKDHANMRSQDLVVATLRGQLNNLEYRLYTKQESLVSVLRTASASVPAVPPDLMDTQPDESESDYSEVASESDTPALLAAYFDRKGDVGVYRERLAELDMAHDDGLMQRELIADRGDALSITDEQFNDDYVSQQNVILRDLEAAEVDAAELAERCKEAGFRTDITRRLSTPAGSARLVLGEHAAAPTSLTISPTGQATNVDNWLESLEEPTAGVDVDDIEQLEQRSPELEPPQERRSPGTGARTVASDLVISEVGPTMNLQHTNADLEAEKIKPSEGGSPRGPAALNSTVYPEAMHTEVPETTMRSTMRSDPQGQLVGRPSSSSQSEPARRGQDAECFGTSRKRRSLPS